MRLVLGVSGIDTVVPSNSLTWRPRQHQALGMRDSKRSPTIRDSRCGIASATLPGLAVWAVFSPHGRRPVATHADKCRPTTS
ncbi:MAG: hypothetical protein IPJ50_01035 [Betaproteobacteria bacterium]|nr:hypothetical protein [Betaproteobacteria bacterium]